MCQPLDFYGFNSYTGVPTKAGPDGNPVHPKLSPGYPHTLFLWKVTPEVLYWGPKFMAERYKLPDRHHGKRHVELRLGCAGWRCP